MRAQGIGGVFLYANDVEGLANWYAKAFGLELQNWGTSWGVELPSADREPKGRQASTTFAVFPAEGESTGRQVMVNWRVDDLDAAVAHLNGLGAAMKVIPGDEYGRFARGEDPEGNGVELWEPAKTT